MTTLQNDHDTPEKPRRVGRWVGWSAAAVAGFVGGWFILGIGYGLGLLDGATGRPLPESWPADDVNE